VGSVVIGHLFLYFFNIDTIIKINLLFLITLIIPFTTNKKSIFINIAIVCVVISVSLFNWDRRSHHAGLFRIREHKAFHYLDIFKVVNIADEVISFEDGPNTTVTVTKQNEKSISIFVNGKADGSTTYDLSTMMLIGIIPFMYLEKEKDIKVSVVGLGTGVTAGTLGALSDISDIEVLEISLNKK